VLGAIDHAVVGRQIAVAYFLLQLAAGDADQLRRPRQCQ
jgi:hypothetical protein